MKRIKYKVSTEFNIGTEEKPQYKIFFSDRYMFPVTHENIEAVKAIAYNGEYTIEDDGKPEPAPTQLDRIEAQTTYTAMMTDTLLEG